MKSTEQQHASIKHRPDFIAELHGGIRLLYEDRARVPIERSKKQGNQAIVPRTPHEKQDKLRQNTTNTTATHNDP